MQEQTWNLWILHKENQLEQVTGVTTFALSCTKTDSSYMILWMQMCTHYGLTICKGFFFTFPYRIFYMDNNIHKLYVHLQATLNV